ncbi:MAG: hypothetical protein NTY02_15340 [Acidobacteria bacterium]|nr:hypothetical protein [Acidobacteriota bacterium]
MKTRFAAIVAWLVTGHLLIGGLYWLLLQVPESNVFMLTASLLIVVAATLLVGAIEQVGLRACSPAEPFRAALAPSIRRSWLVIFPVVLFTIVWYATAHVELWSSAHAGEIDAWIIAKLGWTKTSGLHTTIDWFIAFVRYGIGVALAVALMASLAVNGVRGALDAGWIRRGCSWRLLLTATVALFVGFWLPWQQVYWRPASLPATWIQPAFATAKLVLLFVAANVAWAVILFVASRPKPAAS